jgi:hypothetical protein
MRYVNNLRILRSKRTGLYRVLAPGRGLIGEFGTEAEALAFARRNGDYLNGHGIIGRGKKPRYDKGRWR